MGGREGMGEGVGRRWEGKIKEWAKGKDEGGRKRKNKVEDGRGGRRKVGGREEMGEDAGRR